MTPTNPLLAWWRKTREPDPLDFYYGAEARRWEGIVWPAKRELMKFWSRFGANL